MQVDDAYGCNTSTTAATDAQHGTCEANTSGVEEYGAQQACWPLACVPHILQGPVLPAAQRAGCSETCCLCWPLCVLKSRTLRTSNVNGIQRVFATFAERLYRCPQTCDRCPCVLCRPVNGSMCVGVLKGGKASVVSVCQIRLCPYKKVDTDVLWCPLPACRA